jgi:hypothetical protein
MESIVSASNGGYNAGIAKSMNAPLCDAPRELIRPQKA